MISSDQKMAMDVIFKSAVYWSRTGKVFLSGQGKTHRSVWSLAQNKWKTSLGSKHLQASVYQNFLRKNSSLFWAVSLCRHQDSSIIKSPQKPNSDGFFAFPVIFHEGPVLFAVQGTIKRLSPHKLALGSFHFLGTCFPACEDPTPSMPLCHAAIKVAILGDNSLPKPP